MAWGDLHAAMALGVGPPLMRRVPLSTPTGCDVKNVISSGAPAIELVRILDDQHAALATVVVTGGPKWEDVLEWVSLLTAKAPCPVVVMHAATTVFASCGLMQQSLGL